MNAVETLMQVRSLIEDPKCWAKGIWHDQKRERHWFTVITYDRYCVLGAMNKVSRDSITPNGRREAFHYLRLAVDKLVPYGSPMLFNDRPETTHSDILALLDLAIYLAQKDQDKLTKLALDSKRETRREIAQLEVAFKASDAHMPLIWR